MWDVSKVTTYLGTLVPLSELSLKLLTLKTVMLCALATAQREQTMCALDLRNKIEIQGSIKFVVTDRLKTSKPGKTVEVCLIPTDNKDICPVTTLRTYISRTEQFRSQDQPYQHKLFLSFVKPHRPVSTATIARWIKAVMVSAGIDTSVFKAHSVRGAAATNAYIAGVSLSQILKMADWSNEHTFRRHYLRLPETV